MRSEAAPAAVVQRVAEATGADLGGVSVQRGVEVGRSASAMSAKAYTTGGQVHLPDRHGSMSSGEGESLVAHELTHVAQQRALGGALPGEDTPLGQELELQAQHVERSVVEGKPLPLAVPSTGHTLQRSAQPSGHASAGRGASTSPPNPAAFAVANGLGTPTADGGVVFHAAMDAGVLASVTEPTDAHVQRATEDAAAATAVQRFIGKVPPPVTALSSTAASASAMAVGAASGGAAGGAEDVEKIVDRVITRLRTELSLNRERLGRSLDL
ncbi:MAG: DUF4157 domain-containing protein [Actinobacteria bacterium]|nr:DUF4157 domain-containing protein [Actinomycetota bacterium]